MNVPMSFESAGIVTGGAGGIGQATAELLLQAGARVVLADYKWDPQTVKTIEDRFVGRVSCLTADVRQISEMRECCPLLPGTVRTCRLHGRKRRCR